MKQEIKTIAMAASFIMIGIAASAEQFVLKLDRPFDGINSGLQEALKVSEIERFEADGASFVVLDAENEAYLEALLYTKGISPNLIAEIDFINSPTIGGGEATSSAAKDGHQTFVIERPIPGVGSFPLAKKEGISRASNAAISQMEGNVEWVHSYLTDIGTFCVYRATDEGKIVEHAKLAGAPLGPITAVKRIRP